MQQAELQADLIDLRSPGPVALPRQCLTSFPIRTTRTSEDDGSDFSFVPVPPPLLGKPPQALGSPQLRSSAAVYSLIDDILPGKDQPGASTRSSSQDECGSSNTSTTDVGGQQLQACHQQPVQRHAGPGTAAEALTYQYAQLVCIDDSSPPRQQPSTKVEADGDTVQGGAPESAHGSDRPLQPDEAAPPETLQQQTTAQAHASLQPQPQQAEQQPGMPHGEGTEAEPPSQPVVHLQASSTEGDSGDTGAKVAELVAELSKVKASREVLARDVGQHKATISKLEGSISSYEKQNRQRMEEIAALKARLAAAEREAADARLAAHVTPERCRVSAKALSDETQRAQAARQAKEEELARLQALLEYEAREMSTLKDFMTQERASLLGMQASLGQQLKDAQADAASAQARAQTLGEQLREAQEQLRGAQREVWTLNNSGIELRAEVAAVRDKANAAQAAAVSAQQQLGEEVEARQRAQGEMKDVRAAGIKLYKQIRAVSHALQAHSHVFAPIPKVSLSIRALQEWCAKQAPYWGALADAAAADADTTTGGAGAGGPAPQLQQQSSRATAAEAAVAAGSAPAGESAVPGTAQKLPWHHAVAGNALTASLSALPTSGLAGSSDAGSSNGGGGGNSAAAMGVAGAAMGSWGSEDVTLSLAAVMALKQSGSEVGPTLVAPHTVSRK